MEFFALETGQHWEDPPRNEFQFFSFFFSSQSVESSQSGAASGAKLRSRSQRGVSDPKEQKLNKPKPELFDSMAAVCRSS